MRSALFLAFERAGKSILAKIPIIAITTSSSINVNARAPGLRAQIMALRLVDDAPGRKERKRRRVRSEVAVRALVRTAGGPPPACAAEADSWCCRKNASAWRRPAAALPGGGRAGLHTVWLRPAAAGPEAPRSKLSVADRWAFQGSEMTR